MSAITSIFGGGGSKKAAPVAPPPPPRRSNAEVQAAAQATRKRMSLAAGRESTIMTGGSGLGEDERAETLRKVLLG